MTTQPFKIIQNSQKQMPCNIEAEQELIGSILVSNEIYDEISTIVDSQKFFDPIHAKIFMFFSLFLTIILAPFPSGLVVYWTINNILTIAQQWVIMRKTKVKTV